MGASSSTDQGGSADRREAESVAASSGALQLLQARFSTLADRNFIPPESLKDCLNLSYKKNPVTEGSLTTTDLFLGLLDNLGSSIVELYFPYGKEGVSWLEFVRGYNKCCSRMSSSMSFNELLRIFSVTAKKSGLSLNLEFESEEDSDCKISGCLKPIDVLLLIRLCWSMIWDSQSSKLSKPMENIFLPDVSHIVKSAIAVCSESGNGINLWDPDVSSCDAQLPIGKFQTWVLQTLPSLPDCFAQFVHARIQLCKVREPQEDSEFSCSSVGDISTTGHQLLTHGVAWAISLTMRNSISEELSSFCFSMNPDNADVNLLYRSSMDGRGLNRFWSNVEGYQGPLLLLVSACSQSSDEGSEKKWTIGALTQQGFENRDLFYGSSGHLYALYPVFHSYSSTGKEKNFVYSHLHPTGKLYEPRPKPVGIGFGGTVGNERVFLDEDFSKLTVRHHAVDKTYQHGLLFPDQGFLPVEALILEVEVWGLGGKRAKLVQDKYKKREELFNEQRRKIDLKNFANWEDSPEKMMMDMMSDPNAVRREDR